MPIVRERRFVRVSAGRVVSNAVPLPRDWGGIEDLRKLSDEQLRAIGWFPLKESSDGCSGCKDSVFHQTVVDVEQGFAESRFIDDLDTCKQRALSNIGGLRDALIEAFQYGDIPVQPAHYSALVAAVAMQTEAVLDYGENDVTLSVDQAREALLQQQSHIQKQRDWARGWWKRIRACRSHDELIGLVDEYRADARDR